jgi:hypothetical protein
VQVADAQGVVDPGASSKPIVSFEVDININVNETIGLPQYQPKSRLTWEGETELKTSIDWVNVAEKPWENTTFFISTAVWPPPLICFCL